MVLQLHNTLSGRKEPFQPHSKTVKMYCCGVTPYSNTHIGHSRTFFSYDLLYRTLADQNYDVEWARNITDVDDKIIKKANDEGVSCEEIVNRYVGEQDEMLRHFNLHRPQYEPKVTDNIPQIIAMIEKLIERGFAYTSASGVYYRVRKFPGYGKLSKNNIDDLQKGVRIEVDESKEDALDFALWKFAKPQEIKWASPWGEGRPGWHIECSAMIHALFGESIDIHMGGRDLIFPHHEAEIAQSEGATGKPFSAFWLHAGMVTLYGDKMSKSTNHYVSIADFLKKYPQEVLRLTFLSVSYAQPLDFTMELADENFKKLAKIYRFVELLDRYSAEGFTESTQSTLEVLTALDQLTHKMRDSLADDLNSAGAMGVFFEAVRNINAGLASVEKAGRTLHKADAERLQNVWPAAKAWLTNTLGLVQQTPAMFFASLAQYRLGGQLSPEDIEQKLVDRQNARTAKDWTAADKIRDELLAQGVVIQDTPRGTRWTLQI
ncbi:MAG: cysteine--tRNA ligase [Proteobacteria bacterium]|nr:cysteine--tRNA ligase [Pseudomonadota bacterium]